MPSTHPRRDSIVELLRFGVGGVNRIRSSRRLAMDSVDDLETVQADFVAV